MVEQYWLDYISTFEKKKIYEQKNESVQPKDRGGGGGGEEEEDINPYFAISLDDCCTWPGAGMEIRDDWTWSMDHRRHSTNTTSVNKPIHFGGPRSVGIASNMCSSSHDTNPFFAVSMSNGTIGILHSIIHKDNDDCYSSGAGESMSWGIAHDLNQVVFGVPCIGMGMLDENEVHGCDDESLKKTATTNSAESSTKYIACCLRGGTVFLLPVCPPLSEENEFMQNVCSNVIMYDCPVDLSGDEDGLLRFVQGFTIGYIQPFEDFGTFQKRDLEYKPAMSASKAKPLLLYTWAGGMIDVYECASLNESTRSTGSLGTELLKNGTMHLLVEQLLNMEEDDECLLLDSLWKGAWTECKSHIDATIEHIVQCITRKPDSNFECTRSLLLLLASGIDPNYQ